MPLDSRTISSLCPRFQNEQVSPCMCPNCTQRPRSRKEIVRKKGLFHCYNRHIVLFKITGSVEIHIPQYGAED